MTPVIDPRHRRHFALAMLIVGVLAYLFWTGSRYPSLNEKAMMSGAIQLEDALSFEAKFPIDPDMGMVERIFWSTLNWINTNRKGMTFGVLFAAAFLTAAGYLRRRSLRGSFSNSFLGLAIGTPLGVCVNCAAPIAKGMYASGLRAETTLSAMIASPTLNIVVLTMLFSLVPVYMAVLKIGLSLAIILLVVPLIARVLPRRELPPEEQIQTRWNAAELDAAPRPPSGLGATLWEVAASYAKNLWYIVKMTVPLMILAGFLGTVAAVLLPAEAVLGLPFMFWMLVLVALVGVFLPVPIGFDVVMAGALLAAGMSQGYVMALLFTLGTFSVYSFFIVAGSVGPRAAWMLAAAVTLGGIGAGWGAQAWHERQSDRALEMLLGGAETDRLPFAAQAAGAPGWQVTSDDAPRIAIAATPFRPREGDGGFTRMEAVEAGIDKPLEFSMYDMWPPFWEGRSLASGDLDNDGDLDLVIASTEAGLYLYDNDGTGAFTRREMDLGALADMPVFNAVIADIDNDGWRDLLIATWREGLWLWRNEEGAFAGAPVPVANREDAVLAMALSLHDPDRDGDLDVALGNWAAGWYRRVPGEESRNRILWNDAGRLDGSSFTDLPGIPGETLSILFSDIDRDGAADLLVGNDFEIPDYVYMGDGAGGFSAIAHAQGLIPHVPTTTMAIKVADLMNDGRPEIYLAQIAGRSSGVSERLRMQPLARYCDGIESAPARATCAQNMAIKSWYRSGNNFDPTYAAECQKLTGRLAGECKGMLVKDLAIQRNDPAVCALIPVDQPRARGLCDLHFLPTRQYTAKEAEAGLRQILRANVLLEWQGAAYADTAAAHGLEVGGWSWDTKVADFDHDGWQDVYIVNGTWVPNEVSPSNLYFRADGQGGWQEASEQEGLTDYLMTAAATRFDMDGDGDLDILTHPVNGPLALFRNDGTTGRALTVTLQDFQGNRDGIGAVLTLTDDLGVTRSREILLGGGFMSFDAPVAHFGLGEARRAEHLAIRWADGTETRVAGPLEAGHAYRVMRAAP